MKHLLLEHVVHELYSLLAELEHDAVRPLTLTFGLALGAPGGVVDQGVDGLAADEIFHNVRMEELGLFRGNIATNLNENRVKYLGSRCIL